jgi:hypothetical protein
MFSLDDIMGQAPEADDADGATAAQVLSGKTYWSLRRDGSWGFATGTMANVGAENFTPGVTDQTVSMGYHDGTGTVSGDADLTAGNISSGVEIFGVTGTATVATGNATVEQVLLGQTFSTGSGSGLTGAMPNIGQQNVTPGTMAQTITLGYHDGTGTVAGDTDLSAGNIASGVDIFGVTGSAVVASGAATDGQVLSGVTYSNASGSSTGTMTNVGQENFTPGTGDQMISAGYHDGSGLVSGDADLVSGNVRSGVSIFGVAGDSHVVNTSSGDAIAGDLLSGKKAWVDGAEITGTIVSQSIDNTQTSQSGGLYSGFDLATEDTELISTNIRSGVSIYGVSGNSNVVNTSSGDALATDIAMGKKAWVDGVEVTGTSTEVGGGLPAPVPQTGQTTSYAIGDDGDLEAGVAWASPRFTDNGDGTVTDNNTGLMWLKNANAIRNLHSGFDTDGTAGDGRVVWQSALDFVAAINAGTYAAGVTPAGTYTDWRLPNVKELQSLIDFGYFNPALSNAAGTGKWTEGHVFSGVRSNYYWSSTSDACFTDYAWYVYLDNGDVRYNNKTSNTHYVWPVRGGQ